MGLVHIPGSPLSAYQQGGPQDNCFYPPGFEPDPVAQNPIGDGDSIDSVSDLTTELQMPTNSTDNGTGTIEGDGNPFGFLDSLSRSLKSVWVLGEIITGGYIFATLDHIMIACEMDKDPNSPTYMTMIPMDDGTGGNAMWDYIKMGLHTIIGVLICLTLFYWVTGRGHILSS